KERLLHLLPSQSIKSISHIGSTAVPNIWAKNIVDILYFNAAFELLLCFIAYSTAR
ncbi:MAG: GrpB family protein, partial [Leptotrichia wadei]